MKNSEREKLAGEIHSLTGFEPAEGLATNWGRDKQGKRRLTVETYDGRFRHFGFHAGEKIEDRVNKWYRRVQL